LCQLERALAREKSYSLLKPHYLKFPRNDQETLSGAHYDKVGIIPVLHRFHVKFAGSTERIEGIMSFTSASEKQPDQLMLVAEHQLM
jgi:hypothetical protein